MSWGFKANVKAVRVVGLRWLGLLVMAPLGGLAPLALQLPVHAQTPDIQVTTPIAIEPLSVEQGEPVTLEAEVSNRETVPLDRPFDVAFLAQRDGEPEVELGPDVVRCLTFPKLAPQDDEANPARCRVPGLSARGQPNDKLLVRARLDTGRLAPGQYTIFVVADPDNEIAETREDNNRGEPEAVLVVRPPRPNLTLLATFTLTPPEPRQGDLLTVTFTLENDRPADVTAPIPLSFLLRQREGVEFRELRPPSIRCPDLPVIEGRCTVAEGLRGHERRTLRVELVTRLLDPGAYELRIVVDPDNEVTTEADEGDNVLTLDFVLRPPPRNLRAAEGRVTPPSVVAGQPVSALVVVRNESPVPISTVELDFLLTPLEATGAERDARELEGFACGPVGAFVLGEDRCRELALDAQSALQIVVQFSTAGLTPGRYELRVVVDPAGLIEETDETDNALALAFRVVETPEQVIPEAGPELHPVALRFTPSSPVPRGAVVLVTAEVENSGTRDAGPFVVEFALRREREEGPEQDFVVFGVREVSGLRVGRTVRVQVGLDTSGLAPGLYAVRVVVRPLGNVELDPDNNALIAFLTVREPGSES